MISFYKRFYQSQKWYKNDVFFTYFSCQTKPFKKRSFKQAFYVVIDSKFWSLFMLPIIEKKNHFNYFFLCQYITKKQPKKGKFWCVFSEHKIMVASFHFLATFSAFLVQQKGMLFFKNFVPLFVLPLFSLFLAFCIPQNAITMNHFIIHFHD